MTAPSASARVTPTGNWLDDGYQTLITLAADTNINFWEKSVKPYGADGGEPIDMRNMFTSRYVPMAAQSLIVLTPITTKVAYATAGIAEILAVVNVETTITLKYPDASTDAFYGYLQKFEPDEFAIGSQPEATITIVPTCWDPTALVETGVTYVAGLATD